MCWTPDNINLQIVWFLSDAALKHTVQSSRALLVISQGIRSNHASIHQEHDSCTIAALVQRTHEVLLQVHSLCSWRVGICSNDMWGPLAACKAMPREVQEELHQLTAWIIVDTLRQRCQINYSLNRHDAVCTCTCLNTASAILLQHDSCKA